jgi:hypothetical protein
MTAGVKLRNCCSFAPSDTHELRLPARALAKVDGRVLRCHACQGQAHAGFQLALTGSSLGLASHLTAIGTDGKLSLPMAPAATMGRAPRARPAMIGGRIERVKVANRGCRDGASPRCDGEVLQSANHAVCDADGLRQQRALGLTDFGRTRVRHRCQPPVSGLRARRPVP